MASTNSSDGEVQKRRDWMLEEDERLLEMVKKFTDRNVTYWRKIRAECGLNRRWWELRSRWEDCLKLGVMKMKAKKFYEETIARRVKNATKNLLSQLEHDLSDDGDDLMILSLGTTRSSSNLIIDFSDEEEKFPPASVLERTPSPASALSLGAARPSSTLIIDFSNNEEAFPPASVLERTPSPASALSPEHCCTDERSPYSLDGFTDEELKEGYEFADKAMNLEENEEEEEEEESYGKAAKKRRTDRV